MRLDFLVLVNLPNLGRVVQNSQAMQAWTSNSYFSHQWGGRCFRVEGSVESLSLALLPNVLSCPSLCFELLMASSSGILFCPGPRNLLVLVVAM